MLPSMLKHALLQMLWQVIFDDEHAFDDALGPSMCSCTPCQQSPLVTVDLTRLCNNGDGYCIVPSAWH